MIIESNNKEDVWATNFNSKNNLTSSKNIRKEE